MSTGQRGDRLAIWNFNLTTTKANTEPWEDIPPPYLFKLPLDPGAMVKRTTVVHTATF